jgi:hypothetical protein
MPSQPIHGDLDHAMKFAEREIRWHQNASPHHGADSGQPEFDLQDRVGVRRGVPEPGGFGRRFIRSD